MPLQASYCKHTLNFRFEAGTSRGVLRSRDSWFIKLWDPFSEVYGVGEAAPLKGLSPDDRDDFEKSLEDFVRLLNRSEIDLNGLSEFIAENLEEFFPSIRFAMETAVLDLLNGGKRLLFDTPFYFQKKPIPINGLIWMGDEEFMSRQIDEKLQSGFKTLKMKIGAIDFDTEMKLLRGIRKRFTPNQLTLRVDANGAFSEFEANEVLHELARIDIHSIEQPIKSGNWEAMARLCRNTPTPVALDEELIGIHGSLRNQLLKLIMPQFLIFKPTLLGGFTSTDEWIKLCQPLEIDWWITSALESNIGLNAICQYTSSKNPLLPQGLGTGSLYHNNMDCPLEVSGGTIFYNTNQKWKMDQLNFILPAN